ncbi:MAG: hypothetical protein NWR99_10625, partial [Verrucomicrobiales bacterium]|nr:hypothetical protein [Verrucomicrobiales bacterium]
AAGGGAAKIEGEFRFSSRHAEIRLDPEYLNADPPHLSAGGGTAAEGRVLDGLEVSDHDGVMVDLK